MTATATSYYYEPPAPYTLEHYYHKYSLATSPKPTKPNQIMSALRVIRAFPSRITSTTVTRTFALSTRLSAAGDAGGTRSGGAASGDAFTKREQASENYEIQRREKEKLQALKAKHEKLKSEAEEAGKELEKAEKEGKQ